MKVVKDSPLELGYRIWSVQPPTPCVTVVIKGTFDPQLRQPATFSETQELVSGERRHDDDPERSLRWPSDLAILKPRGECMLVGSAHAPGGEPVTTLPCRFRVGPVEQVFVVQGDRELLGNRPSPPVPFTTMPLSMERAFGGPGVKANPFGRGKHAVDTTEGPRHLLPNIEDPRRGDAPVIVGPIPPEHPSRARLMGTYDARWARTRWPWFPDDFSWEFFLEAPEVMRLASGFFRGDEPVLLQGLHPAAAAIETALPAVRPRAFINVQRQPNGPASFEEVTLRLDTVVYDGELGKIVLVWRGLAEVPSDSLEELHHFFVAHEPLTQPARPPEELYTVFLARLADEEAEDQESEGEEPPAWDEEDEADGTEVRELEAAETRFFGGMPEPESGPIAAEATTSALVQGTVVFQADEHGTAITGGEQGTMVFDAGEHAAPPVSTMAAHTDARPLEVESTEVVDLSKLTRAPSEPQDQMQEADEQLAAAQAQLEALKAEAPPVEPAAPDPQVIEQTLASADKSEPAGQAMAAAVAALQAAVADVEEQPRLELPPPEEGTEPEQTPRERVLERLAAGDPLSDMDLTGGDLSELDLSGQNLTGSILTEASLVLTNLKGADLSEATLFKADLSGADLTEVKAVAANLMGVVATGVSFARADLTEVVADRANLRGASLVEARAPRASLLGANLREADLTHADLSEAELDQCSLKKAIVREARLRDTSAEESRAEGACFDYSDMTGFRGDAIKARRATMRGVLAEDSSWEGADLREVDFGFSQLSRAVLTDAVLAAASLDGCVLREARLDGAKLIGARLRRADLFEASLAEADVSHSDLRGASLFGAELERASLADAQLDLADLGRTKMAR